MGCCGNRSQGAPCCWGVCGDRLSRGLSGGERGLPRGSAIRRVAPDVAFRGLLTGSTMLLRETSLMPPVPGLPALLSMLFAPVMELRCVRPSALSIAFVKQETSGRVGHSLLERKQVRKPGRDTPGCWPFPVPRCDESSFMIIIKLTLFLSRKLEELTQTHAVSGDVGQAQRMEPGEGSRRDRAFLSSLTGCVCGDLVMLSGWSP